MSQQIKINVDKLISEVGSDYYFYIDNVTNTNIQWTNGGSGNVIALEITCDNSSVETVTEFSLGFQASLVDSQNVQLYEDDNGVEVIGDHIITMTGDIDFEHSDIIYMINKGILQIIEEKNLIILYRSNSPSNVVNKSLEYVGVMEGFFRDSVNIKNPIINIQDYKITKSFNYVYIFALRRYYYVTDLNLSTKNIATLILSEDVLMSHKDLILQQTGYVTRNEFTYNATLNDNRRVILENNIYNYQEQTETSIFKPLADSNVNFEYKYIITVFRG